MGLSIQWEHGGISDRTRAGELYRATINDNVALQGISCPILFQSPSNDFHGLIDDLQAAVTEIKSSQWRVTYSPHRNHQDTENYEVAGRLWFDRHLKGSFRFPATPRIVVNLRAGS